MHVNKRIPIIMYVTYAAFFGIFCRLSYLQIFQNAALFHLGQKNFLRLEKVLSPRGNIFDINRKLLATNRPITQLFWRGSGNKQLSLPQLKILQALGELFQQNLEQHEDLMKAEKNGRLFLISKDVNFDQLSKILEQFPQHPNLEITTHFKRFYPHAHIASHVLGYLGGINLDSSGKMGLEKLFNDTLKGTPGEIAKTINSVGVHLSQEEIKKALTGQNLHTTIDLDMSLIAEEVFPEGNAGVLLVMEAQTGAINVMLSRPHFDSNVFLDPLETAAWQQLQNEHRFLNRCCSSCYPPASLFKLVTMAAALETKLIDQNTHWFCDGHITYCNRVIQCHNHEGHGIITPREAVAKSCNIPFYDIAKHIKIDTLAEYAQRLGLGKPTGSAFPERSGLVPTSKWKRETRGEPWWPGETLSAAIGQSVLLVTPLQIACMVGGICEGYRVIPRILINEPVIKDPVAISAGTLDFLKKSMKRVVVDGSGKKLSRLANMEIYAKTGTAQTSDLSKREKGLRFMEHGWLAAHITYKNEPPFVLIILIENAGSSSVSTTVALEFLKRYSQHIDSLQ
jgi:Cell division protein FtsI/penicillin-binding protein 2